MCRVTRREGREWLLAVARFQDRSRGWSVRKCPRHIRHRIQLRSAERRSVHQRRRIAPTNHWVDFRPARRRREKASGRNNLLGLARTRPKEFGHGPATVLIVFDPDVVPCARGQRYRRTGTLRGRLVNPTVNNELVVDSESADV